MLIGYSNNSATLDATITGVLPAGWSLVDSTGLTMQRTIEGDYTPLEIVEACRDTYGVYFRFDNVAQTVTVIIPDAAAPLGAFATRQLNLKEINYKGKSTDFVTRLYAYGADGLSFASINNGLPYVDNNTYSDKIVCAVWKDDRYTVAENLLADAKAKLAVMAVPDRSYDCDVVDLRATNPEMYGFLNFDVFSVATLIDDAKGFSINYQVVERWDYPYYPEKNKVIFSSSPAKIQSQVAHVADQISNPNSSFQQQQAAAIGNATKWLTSSDGYVVAVKGDDGVTWKELLFLDQPSTETAVNVLRINTNGIGFSTSGVNGPYTNAWTIDGKFVADFIASGTINAALVKIINLIVDHVVSTSGNYSFNIWAAVQQILDSDNLRLRSYVTGTGVQQSIGILQVFSGAVSADGTMSSGAKVTQVQPNYIECGSDGAGNYSGTVNAGKVTASSFNLAAGGDTYYSALSLENNRLVMSNLGKLYIGGTGGTVGWKSVQLVDGSVANVLCLT